MNTFLLSFDANTSFGGGNAPTLEVLIGGVVVSSVNMQSGASSYDLFIEYSGSVPSSVDFRFAAASGDPGDTISFTAVSVNNYSLNLATDLTSTLLSQGQSSGVTSTADSFGHTNPTLGSPTITGTALADLALNGTAGNDIIDGLAGNDRIRGAGGDDRINGGIGADRIFGEAGADTVLGGAGNDNISGGTEDDTLFGEADNDSISGGDGNDVINGGTGNDNVAGDAGNDRIYGEDGTDGLFGDAGDDIIFGDGGDDIIGGGDDNDTLSGGDGLDYILGGAGNDLISGGADADEIYGEDGVDLIYGDAGNDVLYGGTGVDTIDGGADDDTINLANGDFAAGESITGGANTDAIVLTDATTVDFTTGTIATVETLSGSTLNDDVTVSVTQFTNFSTIDLAGGADVLTVLTSGTVDVTALSLPTVSNVETGNLTGSAGADDLTITGAQLDAILAGSGVVNFNGGADILRITTTSADLNTLGATDASIQGLETVSAATAGAGVTITLGGQTEGFTVTGSGFADTLTTGSGGDTINSGAGADTIDGGAGNDTINLANGDFASGESLTGGANTDAIVLTNATTVDFTTGTIATVETLTGSTGNDDVTVSVTQFTNFSTIDLAGGTDIVTVQVSGTVDVTASSFPTVSNVENGSLTGSAGADDLTITGAQLDSIINGSGTINFNGGADVLRLTSTSADFNTFGATDASIQGLETVSAATAGAGVTITLSGQTEGFTVTGSGFADTITTGSGGDTIAGGAGADTIDGGAGNDTINLANGDFAAGESITGGANTDAIVLTNATTVDFTTGTIATVETLTGSAGNDDVTVSVTQFASFSTIDLAGGAADILTVQVSGTVDVTGLSLPTVSNVETGNLTGSAGADDLTITGAQLDAILAGSGVVNFNGGADILRLTSTSADFNTFGATDASIQALETVSAATAAAGVTITLSGQTEGFTVTGSGFADTLTTGSGNDTVNGGAGNDTITGGTGADTIDGGANDDTINLANGDFASGESITGGANTDTIVLTNATTVDFTTGTIATVETLTGSAGNDDVTVSVSQFVGFSTINLAGGAADILTVQVSGTIDVTASSFPTVSNVETGNLTGSAGADDLTITGAQLDSIITGTGTINFNGGADVLRLTSTSADLNTLGTTDASIQGLETVSAATAGAGVTITLSGQTEAFTVTGSGFADTITTGSGNDTINGGAGNDTITGGTGVDTIDGGANDDTINLANGDFAAGESITGGANTDAIVLTNATTVDFTTGTIATVETLTGSGSNDTVTMSDLQWAGFTTINLGAGAADVLNVVATGDISASGTPTVSNAETGNLTGTGGNDSTTMTGAQLNAILIGTGTINLGAGASDTLNLTSTSTDLNALNDASITNLEIISASTAAAGVTITLSSQTEGFTVTGSGFADTLTTGSGADTINGGAGNDTITSGTGADTIDGGANDDTINLANGDFASGESITGGANTDAIVLTNATTVDFTTGTLATVETLTGSTSNDTVTVSATQFVGFSTINLQGGTDTLNVQAIGTVDVTASSFPTVSNVEVSNLTGSTGADDLTITGAQLDAIIIGTGTVNFAGGTDTLNLTSTSADFNTLGTTDASIQALENVSAATAAAGVTITLSGQTEAFTVTGGGFADTLTTGSGADTINGGAGNDTITGGTGADTIDGGANDDTINLANGDFASGESITGGANTDAIVLTNATTVDFTTGTIATVETLTGSTNNDNVTVSATQFLNFSTINLQGGTDTLTVQVSGTLDVTALSFPTVSNVENGSLTGSTGADDLTITGAQLDSIISGTGTINFNGGTDILRITSTSADLNTLGATDASIQGLETISAATAGAGVTITLSAQTEAFTITGSGFNDTITAGTGADTIDGGAGDDTINLANGAFASGESITGGNGTDTIVLTNATTVNFTTGTLATVENLTGSTGNDTVTMSATQWAGFTNINHVSGTDILNVTASGDISALGTPTVTNVDTGNLTGTGSNDSTTMTGAQLNAILIGTGTINLGAGASDTLNITSTSTDLNGLNDASITNTEIISASTAAAGVTITLSSQTEGFTVTGSGFADTITTGSGADTINGGSGNDTLDGSSGNDTINGDANDDTVIGGVGSDTLNGGTGADTIYATNNTAATTVMNVNFNTGTDGWAYADGGFGGSDPANADATGTRNTTDGGAGLGSLEVYLDGQVSATATNISGNWSNTFNVSSAIVDTTLTFSYRLFHASANDSGENVFAYVDVDGTQYGTSGNNFFDSAYGVAGTTDTGWVTISLDLGTLSSGNHTISIGILKDSKTRSDEDSWLRFDDVSISGDNSDSAATNTLNGGDGNDVLYGSDATDTLNGGNDDDTLNSGSKTLINTVTLASANFGTGNDSFTYADGGFGGSDPANADATGTRITTDGDIANGSLEVYIDGLNGTATTNVSGNWSRTFSATNAVENVQVAFSYRHFHAASNDAGENSTIYIEIDGTRHGVDGNDYVSRLLGGVGTDQNTGWVQVVLNLTGLSSGSHTITMGILHSAENNGNEDSYARFDDLTITGDEVTLTSNILNGDAGADTLNGGQGTDTLNGGAGNDTLYSGSELYITATNTVFSAEFNTGNDGFAYTDGGFGGTDPANADATGTRSTTDGDTSAGSLEVYIDGLDGTATTNVSGKWSQSISFASDSNGTQLFLSYRHSHASSNDAGENSTVYIEFDGVRYGVGSNDYISQYLGGVGSTQDSGWVQIVLEIGDVTAGSHTLTMGILHSAENNSAEDSFVRFDDLLITGNETNGAVTTLNGGDGLDTLYGSDGIDHFLFENATAFNNIDVIHSFNTVDGDAIDLSDLLSAYDPFTDAITDFVQITTSGSDSILKVDVTGSASFGAATQIATIIGVTGLTDEDALETAGSLITT